VLGLHWRTATPDQRKRFVDAFYHSLLNNYGAALSEFTSDKLKIFPANVDPGSDRASVRTEVKRDNGDRIAVNYAMRKTPTGWKAVDVNIDGISYVKSYHDDFDAQIDQQGMDAVISRLEKGEKPGDISKTTSAGKS
jgi:phospholipid transport system substrate-binding protein